MYIYREREPNVNKHRSVFVKAKITYVSLNNKKFE